MGPFSPVDLPVVSAFIIGSGMPSNGEGYLSSWCFGYRPTRALPFSTTVVPMNVYALSSGPRGTKESGGKSEFFDASASISVWVPPSMCGTCDHAWSIAGTGFLSSWTSFAWGLRLVSGRFSFRSFGSWSKEFALRSSVRFGTGSNVLPLPGRRW